MSRWDLRDQAAVAGVGRSPYGRRLGRGAIDLAAEALRYAMEDAGLDRDGVDGLIVSFGSPIGVDADMLATGLGLKLRAYDQTWAHGRVTASCIQWAAMLVSAGLASVVACLGLVLNGEGFPKAREIFAGNRHDSNTPEEMLGALERRTGKWPGTTVVVDRSIADAENLQKITARGYHYLVAARQPERGLWLPARGIALLREARMDSGRRSHDFFAGWRDQNIFS